MYDVHTNALRGSNDSASAPSRRFANVAVGLWLATALFSTGCNRSNAVFQEAPPAKVEQPAPQVVVEDQIVIQYLSLPTGLSDLSVNRASATLRGDLNGDGIVQLRTEKDSHNLAGNFNSSGLGNRALLGLPVSSGFKLAEFIAGVSFEARAYGTRAPQVILTIDLNCDGSEIRTLSGSPYSTTGNDYDTYSANPTDEIWRIMQHDLVDPVTGEVIVENDSTGNPKDLLGFMVSYPNACFKNSISSEQRLPKNKTLSGVMLSLGDDETLEQNILNIRSISVGSDSFGNWSAP